MAPSTTTRKPRVKLGRRPYTYHVESRTTPGTFYVTDAYRLTCSCPAGPAHRGCWHLRLALAYHDWRKRQAEASTPASRLTGMVPYKTPSPKRRPRAG